MTTFAHSINARICDPTLDKDYKKLIRNNECTDLFSNIPSSSNIDWVQKAIDIEKKNEMLDGDEYIPGQIIYSEINNLVKLRFEHYPNAGDDTIDNVIYKSHLDFWTFLETHESDLDFYNVWRQ